MKPSFLATGLLAGTIIGAGIFSLPYVFSQLGFILGSIYLLILALVYFLVHYRYAEVVETEGESHHFIYYSRKLLSGLWGKIAGFLILGELILVMTVYLILALSFLTLIFGDVGIWGVLPFWFLGSALIFARSKWQGSAEIAGTLGILVITAIIFFVGASGPAEIPQFKPLSLPLLLLPFGPLLFSLGGRAAIPKVFEIYNEAKKSFSLKKVVFWGSIIPIFVYILFVVAVLRLVPNVGEDTVSSLLFLSPGLLVLLGIMGLLTLWTSYFIIGSNAFDILRTDVLSSKKLSGIIAVFTPLALYLLGLQSFLAAVGLAGGVFLALEAIFVNAMWSKVKQTSLLRTLPLYIIFGVALVYEVGKMIF